jgi:uncharacterized phage protein (TIGR02218 family)
MIAVSYLGAPAWLLTAEPNLEDEGSVSLRLKLESDRQRSLVNRETARPLNRVVRAAMRFSAVLTRVEATALYHAMQQLGDEPILVPCWPLMRPGAAAGIYGGLGVGWDAGWGAYNIQPSTPGDWDWYAPLLVCRFASRPAVNLADPLALQLIEFDVYEDGPVSAALTSFGSPTYTNGPVVAGVTPKVFPWTHSGLEPVSNPVELSEQARRALVPAARQLAGQLYDQIPERRVETDVRLFSHADIIKLIHWWSTYGAAGRIYVSTERQLVTATADVSAAGTAIAVDDAAALGDNRYLAIHSGDGAPEVVRVSSIAGNALNLAAPLAAGIDRDFSLIAQAMLARHADNELDLVFDDWETAGATLQFQELPAEYAQPTGETVGATMGHLPQIAWLYTLTLDYAGATEVHRLTAHEQDITVGGHTYTARPIAHNELVQSLTLTRDQITLDTRWWAACPFRIFLPGAMDARLLLSIGRCTVDAGGSTGAGLSVRWTGEVKSASFDGAFISCRCEGNNAIFHRRAINFMMQPGCNYALFDGRCGVDRGDWAFGADLVSRSGNQIALESFARTGGLPSGFAPADYFALGYVEVVVGGAPQRWHILSSGPLADDQIVLTLARPFPDPGAATIVVYPGCNGLVATCHSKFNNLPRFGGLPYVPARSPSFTPLKKSDSPAAKK